MVIVGAGSKKLWLEEALKTYPDISIQAPVPFVELPWLLSSADVHILFQKTTVLDTVMPSKVLGMMASEKPSIVTGHPEAEVGAVLQKSQGGYYIARNEIKDILDALTALREHNDKAQEIGKRARKYVLENYAKLPILDAFSQELREL